MTATAFRESIDIREGAEQWIRDLEVAVTTKDSDLIECLFPETSYLRDNGALTWDFHQYHGRDAVSEALWAAADLLSPSTFELSAEWPEPHVFQQGEASVVEFFFTFETTSGRGLGLLHGDPESNSQYGFSARALYTRLEELKTVVAPEVHPRGYGFTPTEPGENWLQHRQHTGEFTDREPEVLIVGAGQAGLITAAHLTKLGVSSLIIDKHERVGDNWRKRYHSLNLHNPVEMNHFPFLPFPEHFPEYLPKDVLADWLDTYARYLDLDVWSSTEFVGGEFDAATNTWTATVVRADGTHRKLHPQHIVLATGGIGGKPNVPDLPGLSSFGGEVMHSSAFTGGQNHTGKRALVVGTGSSGHDISFDLYKNGVEVTMMQRSPVIIQNVETANLAYASYFDGTPADLVDIRYGVALIGPLRTAGSQAYHEYAKSLDVELLQGLEQAGLRLSDGHEGAGWLDRFLRTGGGYYLNVGASEVIVEGGITLLQSERLVEFVDKGVKLDDGSILEVDVVVLATGYQNRKVEVAQQFGDDVAERVGDIARLDAEGEWANMWSQTAQRGLWFNGGGINQVRPGSKRLALLIKADIDGLIPDDLRRSAGSTNTTAK